MTDPIADFLTRIRNAVSVGHKVVEIPGSKIKLEMTKILKEKGYILNYKKQYQNCIEISSRDKSTGYQITGTCVKTGFTSVH